jgi:hypothetical protein
MHLAEFAVPGGRAIPTLAAVPRVSVLRAGVADSVAVDVSQVPFLTRLDELVAASAVNLAGGDEWR